MQIKCIFIHFIPTDDKLHNEKLNFNNNKTQQHNTATVEWQFSVIGIFHPWYRVKRNSQIQGVTQVIIINTGLDHNSTQGILAPYDIRNGVLVISTNSNYPSNSDIRVRNGNSGISTNSKLNENLHQYSVPLTYLLMFE